MKRLAEGREAEVFDTGDGRVLKLWKEPGPAAEAKADREAAALLALGWRVAERSSVDGRAGLVMDRVEGPNLLDELARRPYRLVRAARTMAEAHAAVNAAEAPAVLADLRADLRPRIERAVALDAHPGLRAGALARLDGLPDGDRLLHGDFHLGNLVGGWSDPTVIDWGRATRGDPAADVARSYLLLTAGETPPEAPALVRLLAPRLRGFLAYRYLTGSLARRPLDEDVLRDWLTVHAAARLDEGFEAEWPTLLDLIRLSGRRRAGRSGRRG